MENESHWKKLTWQDQVKPFVIIRLFGLNGRAIREARWKVKKKFQTCIGRVALARKVNVTMFILMKTFIFICRGRHEGMANVETYRDRQLQTRTDRDRQGQTRTSKDKHGQAWTDMDRQGQSGTERECPCLSLFDSACPCLSLLVPAYPCLPQRCPWHWLP